jgi:hypothetical protein
MYLACKIEESPQHIKAIITEMKTIMQGKINYASVQA